MECLDLKIIKFEPNFYLLNSYQCGWAWPVISADIEVEVYIKYKVYRWTYHDRMHIKVRAEKIHPNEFYIGETDLYIIEDENPSDNDIIKEETIKTTLSYYDIGGGSKGEHYGKKSGWRKWKFVIFTDSGGPWKTITVSAYWDAETCKFTDYKVEGVESVDSGKGFIKLKIDVDAPSTVYKGEEFEVKANVNLYELENLQFPMAIYVCLYRKDNNKAKLVSSKYVQFDEYGTKTVKFKTKIYESSEMAVVPSTEFDGETWDNDIMCRDEYTLEVQEVM